MWLNEWNQLLRIISIGLPVYLMLIVLLRLTGSRSLSKMNAFDSVVSVALGSALATAIMTEGLPGALALGAIALLMGLQFAISWLAVRFHMIEKLTKATPVLLFLEGQYLDDDLRRARLARAAVRAAIRAHGHARVEGVFAVVLETDGSLSVIGHSPAACASALEGVEGVPARLTGGPS